MTKVFICDDSEGNTGFGDTLEEAFGQAKAFNYNIEFDDCSFYEATELAVEMKIIKKEIPVIKLSPRK